MRRKIYIQKWDYVGRRGRSTVYIYIPYIKLYWSEAHKLFKTSQVSHEKGDLGMERGGNVGTTIMPCQLFPASPGFS